jgi:hypothetical protein
MQAPPEQMHFSQFSSLDAKLQAPPEQMHFSHFSSLDAKLPLDMNWVHSSPLLVMHESSLQMQACASQMYKEHYNMLKLRHRQAR